MVSVGCCTGMQAWVNSCEPVYKFSISSQRLIFVCACSCRENVTCGSYQQLEYWSNNFDDFAVSLLLFLFFVTLFSHLDTLQTAKSVIAILGLQIWLQLNSEKEQKDLLPTCMFYCGSHGDVNLELNTTNGLLEDFLWERHRYFSESFHSRCSICF
jgi:hypothetical protein